METFFAETRYRLNTFFARTRYQLKAFFTRTRNRPCQDCAIEVTQLTQEVEEVKTENERLKTGNRELTDRLENVEKKLDDLEGRSKRNNLIFTGLQKQTAADYESWEDCEKLVKDLIRNQLKITEDIPFDRVHRLRNDSESPIIARFTNFKDKQRVLRQK